MKTGQALSKAEHLKFLALGDSYTIGESVAEDQRWPVQLANALARRGYSCDTPEIIAVTGWRTDQLMEALTAKNAARDYGLVSLLIGVNNQYQGKSLEEYAADFEALLIAAVGHARGNPSRVFVLSIPDYGYTPFGKDKQPSISKEVDSFNAVNEAIARKTGVLYINITDISRKGLSDPALIADDGLHPSGKMYSLWVERILEKLVS